MTETIYIDDVKNIKSLKEIALEAGKLKNQIFQKWLNDFDKKNDTVEKLKNYVDQIEKIEEEKASANESIKIILKTAEINGFNKKAIKKLVAFRRKDHEKQLEAVDVDTLFSEYLETISK